jgi:membrane fusion protein, multidrug efflux system
MRPSRSSSLEGEAAVIPMPSRRPQLVPLALVAVSALSLAAGCGPKAPPQTGGPLKVLVAPVLQQDVPIYMEAIGQTRGSVEVEIRARVEGYLESIDYREGSWVHKGQLLYVIDEQPFIADLARARANQASAQASAAKADRDVARYRPLAEQDAISREELDNALSSQEATRAQLDAAIATVRSAELNLGYCRITAPLSGVIGISQVSVGNLVGRGQSTLLTSVSAVDPIWVRFSIPEADYLRYAERAETTKTRLGTVRRNIQLVLADGSTYAERGSMRATERVVDPATGALTLEAEFPNPHRLLMPGQFARVRGLVERRTGAILVPQRAVTELQGTYFVTVVKGDDTVEQRPVRPSQRLGTYWVIDQGLAPGERVVVEGQMRLRPGMKVVPGPVPAGADSLPADLAG